MRTKLGAIHTVCLGGFLVAALGLQSGLEAASPTVEQALKLTPVQKGVDIAQPTPQDIPECKITPRKFDGKVGWIVEDPEGVILRKFVDSDGNNVVDQWSYYKDALEVYRDMDTDHNGRADQFRWFNTAGGRWGVDRNEDGKIDAWKAISAEEVSAEVTAAMGAGDADRFATLVLTAEEVDALGLGQEKADALKQKIGRLAEEFKTAVVQKKTLGADAAWVQFSGSLPGTVPAGTDGSTKDLRVYENAVAIVRGGETHSQLHVGTLIQVGDLWRVIDLPQTLAEGQSDVAGSGFFFRGPVAPRTEPTQGTSSQEAEKLLAELETLDKASDQATTAEQKTQLVTRRADLLEKIAEQTRSPDDRAMWLRQLADMVSAAVQSGTYPDGPKRLEAMFEKLAKSDADKTLAAYFRFRQLAAEYGLALQTPNVDYAKVQAEWLKKLEQYVTDYPTSPDAAEAMLQLAIAQEFAGQDADAVKWYGRIVGEFANSPIAAKAAGARTRLESVGKPISLAGKSPAGTTVDLAKYRGRVVLIQFWATWSDPAKADMATLKELLRKYSRSLSIIGVSLDSSVKDLKDYLAENELPWPQIFEEGGMDSRPANELGILTLPTMILVDKDGKVVKRNIQTAELDRTLKELIR